MKEYLSPGVYFEQYDKSYIPSNTNIESTATFIGAFTKGQAFIPMLIKDGADLIKKTGQPNGKLYSQYAALEYSKQSSNFWVQRLLWSDGYTADSIIIYGTGSGFTDGGDVLAILSAVGDDEAVPALTLSVKDWTSGSTSLGLSITGVNSLGQQKTISKSLSTSDIVDIGNVFSIAAYQVDSPIYLYAKLHDSATMTAYQTISAVKASEFFNFQGITYKGAVTPWITDGNGNPLFRFVHRGDGTYTNKDIKIFIDNIVTGSNKYTKFDVIVRNYSDTAKYPEVYEAFYELSLDPTDDSYIGNRIGDMNVSYDSTSKKLVLLGDYANKSQYIRVELSDTLKTGLVAKSVNVNNCQRIPAWYAEKVISSGKDEDYPTQYVYTASDAAVGGYDVTKYQIQALSMPISGSNNTIPTQTASYFTFACDNFIVPFYGGFDGRNPSIGYKNNESFLMGFDVATEDSVGVLAYKTALDIIKNKDEYKINMISIAGTNLSSAGKAEIFRYALEQVCDYRGDCQVDTDLTEPDVTTIPGVQALVQNYDSSQGAVYFPAVKYYDPYTKTYPILPVATFIPSVMAYTRRIGLPHYAPAGIDRGTLNVVQAMTKLSLEERDYLYKYRVNPIASFAGTGTVVWGQKTLQQKASSLDRKNVRTLLNEIKTWIDTYAKKMTFTNNTASLRTTLTTGIQAYLDKWVANGGLYQYKFIMDDSNNTPQIIDRYMLVGQAWVKFTKTAQFIVIPINIVKTSDQF